MTCDVSCDDNRFFAVDEFLFRCFGKLYIDTELRQEGNVQRWIYLARLRHGALIAKVTLFVGHHTQSG